MNKNNINYIFNERRKRFYNIYLKLGVAGRLTFLGRFLACPRLLKI